MDDVGGTALRALNKRSDLAVYGAARLALFALEVGLALEDIHTAAASCLTEGTNDKKCDLVYVDRDTGRAVIAQSYLSANPGRGEAPANKATDLNTAAAWMLGGDCDDLPDSLKPAWTELHGGLLAGDLTSVDFWYCHNRGESANVGRELTKVAKTASTLLRTNYPKIRCAVHAKEVGQETLNNWYNDGEIPIVCNGDFIVRVAGHLEQSGKGWSGLVTSVPLAWLHELYAKHGKDLFSPNVRDYLGSRKSDRNINHSIKTTAQTAAPQFWAYNNGVTALVHSYDIRDKSIVLHGLGIVNGAQTTGAIGSMESARVGKGNVLARFVRTKDKAIVQGIIRYNNSQNKIDPADFRSNDLVQARLRREMSKIPDALYLGFRRGGQEDKIKRPQNLVPSHTAAQALVAFHQDPALAYNEKARIWESDAVYGKYFHEQLSAKHLLFSFALLRAVESEKRRLTDLVALERTQTQIQQIDFFRQRGSTFLLSAAVASCIEIYLNRALPDPGGISFGQQCGPERAVARWVPVVRAGLPFVTRLVEAAKTGVKNRTTISDGIFTFRSLVEATAASNEAIFATFRQGLRVARSD